MGMSWTTYNGRQKEITKQYYNDLLATGKRHLVYTRTQQDGQEIYFLY